MLIKKYIKKISVRTLLLLSAFVAFFLLSVALIGQYGFNLHPCDLCIYQRIPYIFIIVIGIIGGLLAKSARWRFILAVVCALLFLLDASIAGYHTGVESGIFKGPDACSSTGGGAKTIEELRAEIMNAPLVSCAQAMVYVWGLSMAAWNMIAAIFAFLAVSFVLLSNRKSKL